MGRTVSLQISLSGDDLPALLRALRDDPAFAAEQPEWITADDKEVKQLDRALAAARKEIFVHFRPDCFVAMSLPNVVKGKHPAWPLDVAALLAMLRRLPFTLATVRGIYPEWDGPTFRVPRFAFGQGHHPYGSFAAFKGKGYERLVSRRWLERGPWKLHRDGDLSLVQFHDVDADAKAAIEQAQVGWRRLGPSETGGVFGYDFKRHLEFAGPHSERDRRLTIPVEGREVTAREMLEAASLRGGTLPDQHLDHIAFRYTDEAQARRDLPELWLRELECWAYVDGSLTRLDDDYQPPPLRAPW